MKFMKLSGRLIAGAILAGLLGVATAGRADGTNAAPDFKEVYDLIHSKLAGQSDEDLNRAAVQGLLNQMHAKVSLVSNTSETNAASEQAPSIQTAIYDGPIACVRISQVAGGLADKLAAACQQLNATNKLKGLVLDLRFADGHDYAAAAATADLFISRDVPLLDWGNGVVRSKAKTNAISLPVVVLVNHQTAAAAEALAAVLRESDQALILGANTAGEATIGKDFPLKNGQFLRIATSAIKLGGGEALTGAGIRPDILVMVKPEDEKEYFADPFKEMPMQGGLVASLEGTPPGTNAPGKTRTRTTEADLIRERKERPGMDLEYLPFPDSGQDAGADKPIVRDPVLGRALDLITGIAALRPSRTP
jgi:Peptidase family S41